MTDQEKRTNIETLLREFDEIFTTAGSYDLSADTANTNVHEHFEDWRKGSQRILKRLFKAASPEVDSFIEMKEDNCPPKDYRQYLEELLEDFQ